MNNPTRNDLDLEYAAEWMRGGEKTLERAASIALAISARRSERLRGWAMAVCETPQGFVNRAIDERMERLRAATAARAARNGDGGDA